MAEEEPRSTTDMSVTVKTVTRTRKSWTPFAELMMRQVFLTRPLDWPMTPTPLRPANWHQILLTTTHGWGERDDEVLGYAKLNTADMTVGQKATVVVNAPTAPGFSKFSSTLHLGHPISIIARRAWGVGHEPILRTEIGAVYHVLGSDESTAEFVPLIVRYGEFTPETRPTVKVGHTCIVAEVHDVIVLDHSRGVFHKCSDNLVVFYPVVSTGGTPPVRTAQWTCKFFDVVGQSLDDICISEDESLMTVCYPINSWDYAIECYDLPDLTLRWSTNGRTLASKLSIPLISLNYVTVNRYERGFAMISMREKLGAIHRAVRFTVAIPDVKSMHPRRFKVMAELWLNPEVSSVKHPRNRLVHSIDYVGNFLTATLFTDGKSNVCDMLWFVTGDRPPDPRNTQWRDSSRVIYEGALDGRPGRDPRIFLLGADILQYSIRESEFSRQPVSSDGTLTKDAKSNCASLGPVYNVPFPTRSVTHDTFRDQMLALVPPTSLIAFVDSSPTPPRFIDIANETMLGQLDDEEHAHSLAVKPVVTLDSTVITLALEPTSTLTTCAACNNVMHFGGELALVPACGGGCGVYYCSVKCARNAREMHVRYCHRLVDTKALMPDNSTEQTLFERANRVRNRTAPTQGSPPR